MNVSLIVAIAENNAIGKDNDLLWHLPKDMHYFKEKTIGHHVITGRKNYISIPVKYRPLVDRTNIVLTRNSLFAEDNCVIKHSLEQALQFAKDQGETEVFIIGGGQIYKEALDNKLVDKLYITHVHNTYEADTFFPEINFSNWKCTSEVKELKDEKHADDFTFAVYEKMN